MSTLAYMSKPKPADTRTGDRHKERRMVAIRKQFHASADALIEKLGMTDLTELANVALREKLERENLWPWPVKHQEKS